VPDKGFAVIHTGLADSRELLLLQQQQQQHEVPSVAVGEIEMPSLVAPPVGSAFNTTGSVLSPVQPSTPPLLLCSSQPHPTCQEQLPVQRVGLGQAQAHIRWCVGESPAAAVLAALYRT
jgi:hypothetical protein